MANLQTWIVNATVSLLKLVYPVYEPNFRRDRPLEVMCLGLSRSGTESLSKALLRLGYNDCYHGLQVVSHRMSDTPQWYRLARAKLRGNKDFLCAEEFDKILGHCMALTDAPCCYFSEELMLGYPTAKIVLNRRRDVKAWEKSIKSTLLGLYSSWRVRFKTLFQTDMFWIRLWEQSFEPFFAASLENNPDQMGEIYGRHYENLKTLCCLHGRQYLEWSVEDGWEPLCKFLDKPIPDEPFPQGNSIAEFQEFKTKYGNPRQRKAERNMMLTAAITLSAALAFFAYQQKLAPTAT